MTVPNLDIQTITDNFSKFLKLCKSSYYFTNIQVFEATFWLLLLVTLRLSLLTVPPIHIFKVGGLDLCLIDTF